MAGIMALSVTSSYYEMTEIATRILPNIVVLTFDPDRYTTSVSKFSLFHVSNHITCFVPVKSMCFGEVLTIAVGLTHML
jgi:hypothetical protein